MDHVVFLDATAKEFAALAAGTKTMIIRGAAGRKMPYGRVNGGDILYFLNNDAEGLVKGKAVVKSVLNSEQLTSEASVTLIAANQGKLQLTEKQRARWSGKRYLVLIEIEGFEPVAPFAIDKSAYGNMDDWLPVGSIETVKR